MRFRPYYITRCAAPFMEFITILDLKTYKKPEKASGFFKYSFVSAN